MLLLKPFSGTQEISEISTILSIYRHNDSVFNTT